MIRAKLPIAVACLSYFGVGGIVRNAGQAIDGNKLDGMLDQHGFFNIGKRNEMAARKLFHRNNVVIDFAETGGSGNRTIRLAIRDGKCWLKGSVEGERLI
jgi:hypothetical protein